MRRLLPLALVVVALALARPAAAFPLIDGNTFKTCRYFPVMDTLAIPTNRQRGIYLMVPASGTVRAPVDSLLELWRNGGAVPTFRRMQHLTIMHNSVDEEQWMITIFRTGATTHSQLVTQPYQVLDLSIEADSIQIGGVSPKAGATQVDLGYICW